MSIKQAFEFDRRHIPLTNASHFSLGFGLAVLIQNYMTGSVFLSVVIGWILVGFSLMVHIYSWNKKV
jgi:hypothetical protein